MQTFLSAIGRLVTLVFGRGFGSLKANIGLGLLSLALAVSLWAFVTNEENPTRTDCAPGAIPVETVNVPEGLAVASLSDAAVSVRASAPQDICDHLTVEDFRAVADLSTAKARENSVTLRVSSKRRQVQVEEATPFQVTVTLEPVTTKVVPVTMKLIGTPPLGYATVPGKTTPQQAEVKGAESLVALVEEAVADVNVQGIRVPLDQVFTLVPRDGRGGDIEGVTLNPSTVEVVLPIVQRQITQAYVVTPMLRGAPSDGFNVTSISVEPPYVAITGTIEALQSLTTVATDEVDVDGAASDVVRAAKLGLPAGLTVASGDTVTVRVSISAAHGEITLGLTPTVDGLGPGLRADLATTLVEVRVSGEIPVLRSLSPTSLGAVVDASGLGEGQHVLPVQVTAPPGVQVVGVEPATVAVTLSAA
jgi:YbbR domain-containing protein